MRRLVLATGNPDKVREIEDVFRPLDLPVVAVTCLIQGWAVAETADTLAGNALLKARAARVVTGETTISDDTGLFVDALDGAPGVRSSRYAGFDATYADNVRALLEALRGVPEADRSARFRTLVALVRADGEEREFGGELRGRILAAPRGDRGFGYDPVFFVPEEGRTLAELPLDRKNAISHRARAFRAAAGFLVAHPEWLGDARGAGGQVPPSFDSRD
ncbi:MAG: RdgB/HAM1 family non-canonical purine NTP pyrophosphatase [Gemmatimonadota bacterium]